MVVRAAASDLYFGSLRLVPLNLLWGVCVIAVAIVGTVSPVAAIVGVAILAVPTAAVFALAASIVRGQSDVSVTDALGVAGRAAGRSIFIGLGFIGVAVVLGTNALIGLTQTSMVGWLIGTLAVWGLIIEWSAVLIVWPLLLDPHRRGQSLGRLLRTAAIVGLAAPRRHAALGLLVAGLAFVSTVLVVTILSVGLVAIALLACRAVYPLADRLDPLVVEP